jgi:hypothetical protein
LAKQLRQCEFSLVRYVSDPVKNEFVNIGVLLRDADANDAPMVRFTRDWGRVRCVDPDADVDLLESLESELRRRLDEGDDGGRSTLQLLRESLSTGLQLSEAKGCLAENVAAEMDRLMRLYVERRKREAVSRKSGRTAIYGSMRSHFERAGVWDLMRKRIAAADYTAPGDPLRIDCGYRPNGVIRMFHAVSLEGDQEMAKVLAFSAQGMRDGVRRIEEADLELTAIVEPLGAWQEKPAAKARSKGEAETVLDADRAAGYRFARETMEREKIRVMTTVDLGRIADAARLELRV